MTKYLMAALAVAVASTVLALSFPPEAQLQEPTTADIDSRLSPVIERDGAVKALISLRDLDELVAVPISEWTKELLLGIDWDLRAQHAREVQASVRSVLGLEDAREVTGFQTIPALGATITASGLEKLRNHPDVVAIGAVDATNLLSQPIIWHVLKFVQKTKYPLQKRGVFGGGNVTKIRNPAHIPQ